MDSSRPAWSASIGIDRQVRPRTTRMRSEPVTAGFRLVRVAHKAARRGPLRFCLSGDRPRPSLQSEGGLHSTPSPVKAGIYRSE
jgi:hypothetical protein